MKTFFHDDLDGRAAGHVVYHEVLEGNICDGFDTKFIPINYTDKFPIETIREGEVVYIVDFSLQVPEMEALLLRTKNVVWIDHHKTSINKYDGVKGMDSVLGIRRDGTAGCVLTYMYLYGVEDIKDVPEYIRLIGDRDVWKFEHGQRTRDFCMGIGTLDLEPKSEDWEKAKLAIDHYVEVGSGINVYLGNWYKSYIKSWGYEVEFEGHQCLVVNGKFPAEASDTVTEKYDIAITTAYNGEAWVITFYSRKGVDVSVIAKKYGGGGHQDAAGCVLARLPFEKKKA